MRFLQQRAQPPAAFLPPASVYTSGRFSNGRLYRSRRSSAKLDRQSSNTDEAFDCLKIDFTVTGIGVKNRDAAAARRQRNRKHSLRTRKSKRV